MTEVHATLTVPKTGLRKGSGRSFVSPSTQSVLISVSNSALNYNQSFGTDINAGESYCLQTAVGLTCDVAFKAPPGQDSITVQLWDKPSAYVAYGIGTVLSENTGSYSIGADTQSISFELHGIVTLLYVDFQYDYIPLVQSSSQMPINSVAITINAYDPDSNLITQGDYDSPIYLTDRDNSGITKLRTSTVTTVAQSNVFLDYYGGFIRGTAVDATTPSISAANQQYSVFPAGLAFDSRGGQGKLATSASHRDLENAQRHHFQDNAKQRFDTNGNIQWDGSLLGACSAGYTEGCGLVTMALGETLTMPFTWFNADGPQAYSIEISSGELEVSFNPSTVSPGQPTCVSIYSPPLNGPVSDLMQVNAASPPGAAQSPLMDIGFGVDTPLTLPPSTYLAQHKDC